MTTTCPHCQLPQRVIDGKIEEHRISVDVAHSDFESISCRCPGSGTAAPQAEGGPQRLVRENDFAQTRMAPDPNGQYILHSDHARIVAELKEELAVTKSQVENFDVNLEQLRMSLESLHAKELAELRKELAEEKHYSSAKNETANVFMHQVKRLQRQIAAMRTTEEEK